MTLSDIFKFTAVDRSGNAAGVKEAVWLPSAVRNTQPADSDLIDTLGYRGMLFMLEVSAASGTGGLAPRLLLISPATGAIRQINSTPTPIVATGNFIYHWYPGVALTGIDVSQVSQVLLTRYVKLRITHGDGTNYTYSASYALIP